MLSNLVVNVGESTNISIFFLWKVNITVSGVLIFSTIQHKRKKMPPKVVIDLTLSDSSDVEIEPIDTQPAINRKRVTRTDDADSPPLERPPPRRINNFGDSFATTSASQLTSSTMPFQPSKAFLQRRSPLTASRITPLTPQPDGPSLIASVVESVQAAILESVREPGSAGDDEDDNGIFRPTLKTSPFVKGPSSIILQRRGRLHSKGIEILRLPSSMVIRDLGSIFDAFVVKHSELNETNICDVLSEIRSDEKVLLAAHPTIHAYRIQGNNSSSSIVKEHADDNGEQYASQRIMRVLQQFRLVGVLLVVTRWYGGKMLGPRRFDHITAVAQRCVETRLLMKQPSI